MINRNLNAKVKSQNPEDKFESGSSIKIKMIMNKNFESLLLSSINSYEDTTILPEEEFVEGDTEDQRITKRGIQVEKLRLRLKRYNIIRSLKNIEAFQLYEQLMSKLVNTIDRKELWKAIKNGDQLSFDSLTAQRTGIVSWAEMFSSISLFIKQVENEINILLESSKFDKKTEDKPETFDDQIE